MHASTKVRPFDNKSFPIFDSVARSRSSRSEDRSIANEGRILATFLESFRSIDLKVFLRVFSADKSQMQMRNAGARKAAGRMRRNSIFILRNVNVFSPYCRSLLRWDKYCNILLLRSTRRKLTSFENSRLCIFLKAIKMRKSIKLWDEKKYKSRSEWVYLNLKKLSKIYPIITWSKYTLRYTFI